MYITDRNGTGLTDTDPEGTRPHLGALLLRLKHTLPRLIGGDGGKLREQLQLGQSGRPKPIVKRCIRTPGRNNAGPNSPGASTFAFTLSGRLTR